MSTARLHATRGPIVLLLLGAFVLNAATSAVFALLAELQRTYHLPDYGLGLLSAAAFASSLVAQLTLAGWADRGYARHLLLVGLGLAIASAVLFAAGSTLSVFVIARMMSGLAAGVFLPSARAIAAGLDADHLARNLGRLAGAELAGFTLGPVAGTVVFGWLGLKAPFLVLAIPAALVLVTLAWQPLPAPPRSTATPRPSLTMLRLRRVRVAALLNVAIFLPVGIYDSLWARYLEDRGASTLFVGVSLTLYTVPFVLLAPLGGRLADRIGPVRCVLVALCLAAPVVWAYGLLSRPGLIAGIALVDAVFQAVAVPSAQAAMAKAAPPDRVAAGQGLAGASQQAIAAVVSLVAAPIYASAGSSVVFGGAALAMLLVGALATFDASRGRVTDPVGA